MNAAASPTGWWPNEEEKTLLRSSFVRLVPRASEAISDFYARLFAEMPQMRGLFPRDMSSVQDKFVSMLAFLVERLDTPESFASECAALGSRHVGYGAQPLMYPKMGSILVDTISNLPDSPMSAMEIVLWKRMYGLIAGFMVAAPPARP